MAETKFYPIPSLDGKYEISKSGVVRNAETKHILKSNKGTNTYEFHFDGKKIFFNRNVLIAETFENEKFLPIPSLGGKYEISKSGVVRNAETKHILKYRYKKKPNALSFRVDGKLIKRSINQLRWEVYGVLPKKNFYSSIAVTVQKDGRNFTFDSRKKCAKFLAQQEYYSERYVLDFLQQRKSEIYGWKVFYHEDKRTLKNLDHGIKGRKIKNENY